MGEETDALFARANAAVIEARRLVEINLAWRAYTYAGMRQLRLKTIFEPSTWKVTYPQEIQTKSN